MNNDELIEYAIRTSKVIKEEIKPKLIDYFYKNQERIEYLERSNNRREDTIFEQSQKISDLEDNWDILKNFIDTLWLDNKGIVTKIKDKIKFIEQGGDALSEPIITQ